MNFFLRWLPFPLWHETTWMPVPRSRYDLLERAFDASETWNKSLVDALEVATHKVCELTADGNFFKAEANHYRGLTIELDARLAAISGARSELQDAMAKFCTV